MGKLNNSNMIITCAIYRRKPTHHNHDHKGTTGIIYIVLRTINMNTKILCSFVYSFFR